MNTITIITEENQQTDTNRNTEGLITPIKQRIQPRECPGAPKADRTLIPSVMPRPRGRTMERRASILKI